MRLPNLIPFVGEYNGLKSAVRKTGWEAQSGNEFNRIMMGYLRLWESGWLLSLPDGDVSRNILRRTELLNAFYPVNPYLTFPKSAYPNTSEHLRKPKPSFPPRNKTSTFFSKHFQSIKFLPITLPTADAKRYSSSFLLPSFAASPICLCKQARIIRYLRSLPPSNWPSWALEAVKLFNESPVTDAE
ncbi:hypothetical protein CEXT_782471 [Caerostris extrusa]|uniref:Uncharacterized protein n=1 Tax=Caerostris extrusa TaxID=172846 RepID=A0AAV4MKW3_CAEEX|nr:hypothetical protein CEXT_782471 [Caerostris extrusa]